jgi:hypothetical protein
VGPSVKTFIAQFNKISRPKRVSLHGKDVPQFASEQALESAQLGWHFDPASVVRVRFGPSEATRELVLRLESK